LQTAGTWGGTRVSAPVPAVAGPSVRARFGQLDENATWLSANEADICPAAATVDEPLSLVPDRVEGAIELVNLEADVVESFSVLLEPGCQRALNQRLYQLERRVSGIEIREPDRAIEHVGDLGNLEAEVDGPPPAGGRDVADHDADMIDAPDVRSRRPIGWCH
jgi:hypothetical protein